MIVMITAQIYVIDLCYSLLWQSFNLIAVRPFKTLLKFSQGSGPQLTSLILAWWWLYGGLSPGSIQVMTIRIGLISKSLVYDNRGSSLDRNQAYAGTTVFMQLAQPGTDFNTCCCYSVVWGTSPMLLIRCNLYHEHNDFAKARPTHCDRWFSSPLVFNTILV
jgi:hypothetical protein